MKYETLTAEQLSKFKTFGKKIISISVNRKELGSMFYKNEFTVIYEEKLWLKIIKTILHKK